MTVFWSFSSIDQEFTKTKPRELNSLLGEQEREYLNSLRIEKRRSEWLAGRLALKRLLQAVHAELADRELSEIQILKLKNGAPCLLIDNDLRLNESISLSHSNRHVFAHTLMKRISWVLTWNWLKKDLWTSFRTFYR